MADIPFRAELEGLENGALITHALQSMLETARSTPFRISAANIRVGSALPEGNEIGDIGDLYLRIDSSAGGVEQIFGGSGGSPKPASALNSLGNLNAPTLFTKMRGNGLSTGWAAPGAWEFLYTTETGTLDDWAPLNGQRLLSNTFIQWAGAATATVRGFPKGYNGQQIILWSANANGLVTAHANTGSLYGNRLSNRATSANTPISAGGYAWYVYQGTQWSMVGHEQGSWITPAYASGNYIANGSQTWTVEAGDVLTQAYYLRGTSLAIQWVLNNTSVGGTPNTQLIVKNSAWGSFTPARQQNFIGRVIDNGGTAVPGFVQTLSADSQIYNFVTLNGSGNWSASTNNTRIEANLLIEVN